MIGDGALEAAVLAARDDEGVELVRLHRRTDVPVPALQLCC